MCDEYSNIADLLHDLADSRKQRNDSVNWLVLNGHIRFKNKSDPLLLKLIGLHNYSQNYLNHNTASVQYPNHKRLQLFDKR